MTYSLKADLLAILTEVQLLPIMLSGDLAVKIQNAKAELQAGMQYHVSSTITEQDLILCGAIPMQLNSQSIAKVAVELSANRDGGDSYWDSVKEAMKSAGVETYSSIVDTINLFIDYLAKVPVANFLLEAAKGFSEASEIIIDGSFSDNDVFDRAEKGLQQVANIYLNNKYFAGYDDMIWSADYIKVCVDFAKNYLTTARDAKNLLN